MELKNSVVKSVRTSLEKQALKLPSISKKLVEDESAAPRR